MKKQTLIILLSIATVCAPVATAQYTKLYNPFDVTKDGQTLSIPFQGGINDPKVALVDIDDDNLFDLMIGKADGRLAWYRNIGTAQTAIWDLASERFASLDIGTWFRFVDIDKDGDFDLFCDSKANGVAFYRNNTVGATFDFTLESTNYGNFVTGFNNTPDLVDIDNDGDLDFFFGNVGGTLEFYENTGTVGSPTWVFRTNFYDSLLAYPGAGPKLTTSGGQHGFSNITFADYDADGDFDMFWGDIFNNSMYLFKNLGNATTSDLTWLTEDFLPTPTKGYNHAAIADIDDDGDLDIIVGTANGADINNLRLLRNVGTAQTPQYVEDGVDFLGNIDIGSFSMPAVGDLDGDSDYDLLIGRSDGHLTYYENVGTPFEPALQFVTDQYLGISAGAGASPALADLDADGDLDLLLGNMMGRVEYWRNEGDQTNFAPVLVDNQLAGIKVDQLAIPKPVDLNDDGLLDLVVGEWDFNGKANLALYRNIGTPTEPVFVLQNAKLLKRGSREITIPEIFDYNDDGRPDLILGVRQAVVSLYHNMTATGSFPDSMTLVLQPDVLPGNDIGGQPAVIFVDLDLDGDSDILVGEEDGGLNYYEHDGSCCQGMRDDINGDGVALDIVDLTALVEFLFGIPPVINCPAEADVNGDNSIEPDIVDLTFTVDHLFGSPPTLTACPQ